MNADGQRNSIRAQQTDDQRPLGGLRHGRIHREQAYSQRQAWGSNSEVCLP
jgi:hypothetical protein